MALELRERRKDHARMSVRLATTLRPDMHGVARRMPERWSADDNG
jgi:hypothetical protein